MNNNLYVHGISNFSNIPVVKEPIYITRTKCTYRLGLWVSSKYLQAVDVVLVPSVRVLHFYLRVQFEIRIEVNFLILKTVAADFGFAHIAYSLVHHLRHFPGGSFLHVEVGHLVISCRHAFVFCYEDAAQMRISIMHDFLRTRFRFRITRAIVNIGEVNFTVMSHVTYRAAAWGEGHTIYPSIA